MADAGGAFVTRAFERMLKDAQGKKYINLQNALKEYLDRPRSNAEPNESSPRSPPNEHDETAAVPETPTSPVHSPTAAPGSPARRTSSQVAAAAMAEAGGTLEGSEADLLWLPLRLAFETKQPKLVESALDCLHKLISYGHLEGDAGIESGKNGEMLTEILNKVCSCIDSTATDSTVLQVIKVLLTTVTSSKFRVHGECLLSSIRTCYTIVLNSKSSVNQATAKATLTQMINIVFKRMESEVTNSDASWRAHKEESGKTADASSSGLTVEELQHADIKGLEAALDKAVQSDGGLATNEGMNLETLKTGQRDALLIFRTLCKMSMKEGTDDMIIRTKILSLELLQGLMESVNRSFTVNFAFIDSVKAYLCYGLLRACVSLNIAVFQLACGLFLVLLQRFRESLKAEIGIFFPLIVLRSLDSVDTQLQQRTCVLKMLERTCMDPQILADIFVNYDCDLEATNLFERMVGSLSKMVQGTSPDPDLLAPAQSTALKSSSLQCLVNVLSSLISWSAGPDDKEKQKVLSEQPPTDSSQADTFGKAKAHKSTVEAAIFEFNRNPGKGIEMLISNKLVEHETRAVAKHLRTTPGLDKAMIGDYLGQHEEFQVAVMHAYVDDMNFKELKFDEALREFLRGFRLPGEAQKIDRIMEKFAERYCRENPGIFQNADTAYILAYAVILLNTDAHNPMVWPKMSKEDFVRINSENDAEEHAPTELLEELYESIVQREILVNDNSGSLKRDRKHDMEEEGRLINVLNLGVPKKKTGVDAKHESEEIIQRTQELIKKKGARRGIFYEAKHADLARPMLEAVGWSLLAAFSVTMEDSESKPRVALCMEGFRSGIHLTKFTGMDTLRYAFLTSLIRLTFLHAPKDMRSKNVEALKTLLALAGSEPKTLQDTWNAVLECVSRLEYITSSPSILATLMHGSNQISRDALAQALIELTGKPTEQIFVNTVKLPSDAIVEFFTALCGVSAEELKQNPPRVFSLQKLVEISYYNMARIRMVWARIWSVLSQHFVAAGSHHDEKIAMYAIDSLRQLGMKYFERPELANFTFQNDILKPFVVLMRTSRSARIRALILDCKIQLIKSKVGSIKSGWKSVFMVFTTAAHDDNEEIADLAFENVEQVILEYFDQMAGDCFMDCVNCLITFANNKISSRTSLKAIALLRICENRLAEGQVSGKTAEDADVSEYNWFPMLAGLSDLTSDPRVEVRNCALEVLFDLLKERGHHFSTSFWESVFHRVLFPIFDYVRHAGKNGEKPASAEQWLRETCLHSLQLLCDLFSTFYKEVSFLLPSLLSLLLDCATRPDQALAAISIGALVRLSEVGGHQFTEKDWTTLLDSIRDACYTTQPIEILNLDNGVGTPTTGTPEWDSAESQSQTQGQTQTQSQGQIQDSHQISSNSSISNGPDASDPTRRSSFDAREADAHDVPTHIEAEGFNATPPAADSEGKSGGIFGGGRRLVGNVVDALLKKNLTFKARSRLSGSQSPPPSQLNNSSIDDVSSSIGIDDDESENPLLPIIRSKCLTQLLLLGAIDSFQNKHWQRLATSHKIQIMDTLLSMLDFASSYNSDSNFRNRIQQMSSGDIPPPNLLRQEVEGTRVYVAVVNKATADEDEKLREEAERRLVAFYSHILKDAVNVLSVEPHPHPQSLCLRSSVIVKVLRSMSEMESGMFRRHLSEFYPCFTKLICSNQMDVRRALGDLFKLRLVSLLPT